MPKLSLTKFLIIRVENRLVISRDKKKGSFGFCVSFIYSNWVLGTIVYNNGILDTILYYSVSQHWLTVKCPIRCIIYCNYPQPLCKHTLLHHKFTTSNKKRKIERENKMGEMEP